MYLKYIFRCVNFLLESFFTLNWVKKGLNLTISREYFLAPSPTRLSQEPAGRSFYMRGNEKSNLPCRYGGNVSNVGVSAKKQDPRRTR